MVYNTTSAVHQYYMNATSILHNADVRLLNTYWCDLAPARTDSTLNLYSDMSPDSDCERSITYTNALAG
jgi:hypothetical protein